MNTNTYLTLIIGDDVKNGIGTRIEELHHCECSDLKKTIKADSYFTRSFGSVEHFDSIESAREWYNDDPDELGWLFDDEVKILPCVYKNGGEA
jgi:hypothetical protein